MKIKTMILLAGLMTFGGTFANASEVNYCIRFDVKARTGNAFDSAAMCAVKQTISETSGAQVWDCTFKHDGHQASVKTEADRVGYNDDFGGYYAENLMYFESDLGVFMFANIGIGKVKSNSFLQIGFWSGQPKATYTQFIVKGEERDFDMTISDLHYGACN